MQRPPVLRPGKNCWLRARADRAAFLVDGKAYFDALAAAMAHARQRIVILAWDFDRRMRLQPDTHPDLEIQDFLVRLLDANPKLTIHLLLWRNSIWYAGDTDLSLLIGGDWLKHPRLQIGLDSDHPVGAAHHEKIVCIDDKLAFVGGMDLTQRRWDNAAHMPGEPARRDGDGMEYPPIHDIQMMLEGPIAGALCRLACERWRRAGLGELPPIERGGDSAWPEGIAADLVDRTLGVARTRPSHGGRKAVREAGRLTLDLIAQARRSIYIESQYFALPGVVDIIEPTLALPEGPEIVVVTTNKAEGWLENLVMARSRECLFARLRDADRWNRVRLCFPANRAAADQHPTPIGIHAKLLIVDDNLLRIGSSNLNHRSTGLDTECDIAVEAEDEETRDAIRRLRAGLLAEHLGVAPEAVQAMLAETGSLVATIDALSGGARTLAPFPTNCEVETAVPAPIAQLLDPPGPIDLGQVWKALSPS